MTEKVIQALKIHKLTQDQYDRELQAGRIDEDALYLTPYEQEPIDVDLTGVVRSVNDITPDENGNVTIEVNNIDLENYVTNEEFENTISNITPTAKVEEIENGVQIIISDKNNGTTTANVLNGPEGGYYIPNISQENQNSIKFSFVSNKNEMPVINDKEIVLPSGAAGFSIYTTNKEGSSSVQGFSKLEINSYGRDLQIGDIILTANKHLYVLTDSHADGEHFTAVHVANLKGEQGYSPTIDVTENENQDIVITITNGSDISTATIKNGVDGNDGYTPIRGEDYWTEEDLNEIHTYIDSVIDDAYEKGKNIPSGADLNEYTTIGKYYASTNSVASSLVNAPEGCSNFVMWVFLRAGSYKTQIIIDLAGNMFIRSRSSSTWQSWKTYITNKNVNDIVVKELAKYEPLKPEFVDSIDKCIDTDKLYVLPDGYIYAYMPIGVEQIPNFENKLDAAGWVENTRLGSSGTEKQQSGVECTGYIPVSFGDVIYLDNVICRNTSPGDYSEYTYYSVYDKDKNHLGSALSLYFQPTVNAVVIENSQDGVTGDVVQINTQNLYCKWSGHTDKDLRFENMAFFRISCEEITDNSIITVNEPIEYTEGTDIVYGWKNTGHAFINLENVEGEVNLNVDVNFEFVNSEEEFVDTNKVYVTPDGFIHAYMDKIGFASFTNQIENAIDTDGSFYNGMGYKTGWRFNSSNQEVEADGQLITGYIPYDPSQVIRISGYTTSDTPNGYIQICKTNYSLGVSFQAQQLYGTDAGFSYTEDPTVSGVYILTINPAVVTNSVIAPHLKAADTAFIRVNISGYNEAALKVTLDEEISGEVTTTTTWVNTGHNIAPADYEDQIIELKEYSKIAMENRLRIINLELREGNLIMPEYVTSEADSVIGRVIAAQSGRTFTFAAITDMHYGEGNYTDGIVNACKAMKYIDEHIKLDAVAVLGDYTNEWVTSGEDVDIKDFQAINNVLDDLRFAPNLRLNGNHDMYNENPSLTMRHINAYSDDVVWGSRADGYYYRDFGGYKLRVIGLNTSMLSAEQYSWFASALDLSGKEDITEWSILILSHHPLDWMEWIPENPEDYCFCYVLDGYKKGLSGTVNGTFGGTSGEVHYDFTGGKNAAKLIGNIHGHIHNFKVDYIHMGSVLSNNKSDVIRIATPNSCYNRENGYEGVWADDTAYPKTMDSAEETSFCVYCIDLDTCTIKAIGYGAGPEDRVIDYSYTNEVLPPEKKVMDTEVWTFELEDGSIVTKQMVVMV